MFWRLTVPEKREVFLLNAAEAMGRGVEPSTVMQSFARAGLVPFNPIAVLDSDVMTSTQHLVERMGEKRRRPGIPISGGKGYYGGPDGVEDAAAAAKAGRKREMMNTASKKVKESLKDPRGLRDGRRGRDERFILVDC